MHLNVTETCAAEEVTHYRNCMEFYWNTVRPETAQITTVSLLRNKVHEWPACSPEMSPSENAVVNVKQPFKNVDKCCCNN